jgi:hypothetical protein
MWANFEASQTLQPRQLLWESYSMSIQTHLLSIGFRVPRAHNNDRERFRGVAEQMQTAARPQPTFRKL